MILGPTFKDGESVSLETAFPTGHGRYGKGTEYHAFNLALNTWQLHYLRLTNQLNDDNMDLKKRVFERMNEEYTAVMRRFTSQGSWRNWDRSAPSVWLSAWCIRVLKAVSFQDWEDFIYIDEKVFGNAVMWLLNYQNSEGAFVEASDVDTPLHYAMRVSMMAGNSSDHVALTAHVLIALDGAAELLTGHVKVSFIVLAKLQIYAFFQQYCSTGRQRAIRYLEKQLYRINDPYEVAIVTYALARVSDF